MAMDYSIILFANAAMQGAIRGSQKVLQALREKGSLDSVIAELTPWDERQRLVRKPHFDQLELRYSDETA
ncbi:hypothetical protein [Streptomyces mirabilis]|uniref:hypothetical protein n=1 Tax=Streptomyces mirabilis TaxID=68239 RepID=UPI0033190774